MAGIQDNPRAGKKEILTMRDRVIRPNRNALRLGRLALRKAMTHGARPQTRPRVTWRLPMTTKIRYRGSALCKVKREEEAV